MPIRRKKLSLPDWNDRATWQVLVDGAEGALALDSARKFGLVTGGPEVNIERCEQILREGLSHGYRPSTDAIERFASGLTKEV